MRDISGITLTISHYPYSFLSRLQLATSPSDGALLNNNAILSGGGGVVPPLNLDILWHVQKYRLTQIILRRHEVRVIFSTGQIVQPCAHPHTRGKRKVQQVV